MDKIKILIADDHHLVREGIRIILEQDPSIKVIGEACNGREAILFSKKYCPDVILMDISMPLLNGLEATRQLQRDFPQIKVLALSVSDDEDIIRQMLAAGAMGYLTKYANSAELIQAILTVHNGNMALSPTITRLVVEDYLRWADIEEKKPDQLTPREREVLQLIAEGYSNREIADILKISIKTVQAHRNNLMQKLNLNSQGELTKYAVQKKIIHIS